MSAELLPEEVTKVGYSHPFFDDPSAPWWLACKWLNHRHTVEEIYPLLLRLQEARGSSFMMTEHVLAVMAAEDPQRAVDCMLGLLRPTRRRCAEPDCTQPVSAVNAKYCAEHAEDSRKESHRMAMRRYRRVTKVASQTP